METWQLMVIGVIIHLVFFYSIFDIYFTSPLVHGMTPVVSSSQPPAKRLVLFVADGLRADKFFELDKSGLSRAPFLRGIIENQGAWGVSHTRVPTESRPGHVALIAGFYEDVSAVAKGWKENPVEFDSVFNESANTWAWGSPDILPMFAKGASGDHVFTHCYPAELEDFAGTDSSRLDTWVFHQVTQFLVDAKQNASLMKQLQQDRVVFFLHLLGIDTNGHSHKPYSSEYLQNIGLVDYGIQKFVDQLELFFHHDGQTAYIMTADHGMTNWGSHGSGQPHETRTPLVAWGAGVRGPHPLIVKSDIYDDGFTEEWDLSHLVRHDVEQADIAPLMATLIGVPFPVNSVGVLPFEYLDMPELEKADSLFANAQQILAQYQVQLEQKKSTTLSFAFRPFSELSPTIQAHFMRNTKKLISSGHVEEAIVDSKQMIDLALKGLRYYQTYDRFYLGASILFGYVGWMGYILILILREHTNFIKPVVKFDSLQQPFWKSEKYILGIYSLLGITVFTLLAAQSLPWSNYLYCLIPVVLWMVISLNGNVYIQAVHNLWHLNHVYNNLCGMTLGLMGLEVLVWSFFQRELLSLGLVCIVAWGVLNHHNINMRMLIGWSSFGLILSVFPLLPVVGRESNYNLVFLAGMMSVIGGFLWKRRSSTGSQYLFYLQLVLVVAAATVVKHTSYSIGIKQGLPAFNQLLSWCILVSSFFLPTLSSTAVNERLLSIGLASIPPYILLSITYEALFVVVLCGVLYFWLQVECKMSNNLKYHSTVADFVDDSPSLQRDERHLVVADLRRALFFIFFILTAFFGTGNIASINSFEPASVYCFLTVFNPFVMGTLMMVKNIIPFILVTCVFRAIHITCCVPVRAMFLLALLMSDFMALHFFFLVRDHGSWLEIGTSISHYVIVMCMIIFLVLLFGLSHFLTSFNILKAKFHPS